MKHVSGCHPTRHRIAAAACAGLTLLGGFSNGRDSIASRVTERCVPPGIVDTLHDLSLAAGAPLFLTVSDTGSTRYHRWYRDGQFLGNDTTFNTYSVASVSDADAGRYHVVVYNACGDDTSRLADVTVYQPPRDGHPTNPVVVRGSFVDSQHIRLRLGNICQLPTDISPFGMRADYIGVWYQGGDYPAVPDTAAGNMLMFDVAGLKTAAGCPGTSGIDTLVEVPALRAPDSVYFLSVAVRWHNPDSLTPFVRANADTVLMRDRTPPVNRCTIRGTYAGGRGDSAYLDIAGLNSAESKVAALRLSCSFDSTLGESFFVRVLSMDSLRAAGVGDSLRLVVRTGLFDGPRQTVYCGVALVSRDGIMSIVRKGAFDVGRDVPPNPLRLSAHVLSSFAVSLSWPPVSVEGADSIRILRDTARIPLDVVDVNTPFAVVYVDVDSTHTTLSDLNPSTTYSFAAQARIRGDWTAVSSDSRTTVRTLDSDPRDTVANSAVIDTAWFDTLRNCIVVHWHYDTALNGAAQFGCVYGVDSAAVVSRIPGTWHATTAQDSAVIELGESVVFDTTFTVAVKMRTRGGVPSRAAPRAIASVRTSAFAWQPIMYFREPVGDTAWANNHRIALWHDGSWAYGKVTDTVRAVRLPAVPQGMVSVGMPFMFTRCEAGPPLTLAVRYDSVPPGYRPEHIRLYRRNAEGHWLVFHDCMLLPGQSMVRVRIRMADVRRQPFALLIDRQPPSIQVHSDLGSPVLHAHAISDTIACADNIANLRVTLLYSRAANAPRVGRLDTLRARSAVVTTTIPRGYVTEDGGVRAWVVVSDGLHCDTVDLSRQVRRERASDVTTVPGKWVPLRTNAILDDNTLTAVIEGITGGGYDNSRCRVFRWFDPAAAADAAGGVHGWVEYEPGKENVFALTPGKLMWIKTRDEERLDFGGGVTVSLREPVTIALSPRNWTDVALPYKFGMHLGDILDATGNVAESLQYYRWTRGGDATYVTDAMYLAAIPDPALNDRTQALSSGAQTGYSIYNPLDYVVTLRIPPIAQPMSSYRNAQRGLARTKRHDSWALRIAAELEGAHRLGTVVLGYAPGDKGTPKSWYPSAPGFGGVTAKVLNRAAQTTHGHVVAHGVDDGGVRFDVLFENNTDAARVVSWRIEGLMSLPDTMAVRVVDPRGGGEWPGDLPMQVAVPARGSALRTLTVGGPSYYVNAYAGVEPFAGFVAYPNPFKAGIAVRFLLPEGVGRLEYRLFDTRGRLVWRHTRSSDIRVGPNLVVWDGRAGHGSATAAATYLLRVRAYDRAGVLLATREQRVVRMR
ncbi:MAG: hypothetical protein GF331_09165 [Chitinivibrionales bacterium]|nr:hypothetical protein [Chitinivibrionales bacterium]